VVVDPEFDAYKSLAASARAGKLTLHFRPSGAAALELARRLRVDCWFVGRQLDDMAGDDLVEILKARQPEGADHRGRIAIVAAESQSSVRARREAGVDAVLAHPVTAQDVGRLLGMVAPEASPGRLSSTVLRASYSFPIGVCAAALAIAAMVMQ
jgi:CheY-like chemotaxis protein